MMPRGMAARDKNIYCAYGILKTKRILFESLKDREKHLEVQIDNTSRIEIVSLLN